MLSAEFRSLTYMELNHVIQIIDGGRGKGKFLHKRQSYQVRHFVYAYLKVSWITQVQVLNVFIPSPVRVSTLLMDMEVPGTPIGASFFFNLNCNLLGSIVQTQTNMNFSAAYLYLWIKKTTG